MLGIAFELIGEVTSNSLLMFCFCNLIIVMIFTGSSKPSLKKSEEDSTFITSMSFGHDDDDDEEMTVADVSYAQDESLINDSSVSEEESIHCFSDDEEGEDEDENEEAEVEEEEEEDDLRMRVEEFIAKINNEWRHEKLRALNLVH